MVVWNRLSVTLLLPLQMLLQCLGTNFKGTFWPALEMVTYCTLIHMKGTTATFSNKNIYVLSIQQLEHLKLSAMWFSFSKLPMINWMLPTLFTFLCATGMVCPLLEHMYFSAYPEAVLTDRSLWGQVNTSAVACRALLLHFICIWRVVGWVFCFFLLGVHHHSF